MYFRACHNPISYYSGNTINKMGFSYIVRMTAISWCNGIYMYLSTNYVIKHACTQISVPLRSISTSSSLVGLVVTKLHACYLLGSATWLGLGSNPAGGRISVAVPVASLVMLNLWLAWRGIKWTDTTYRSQGMQQQTCWVMIAYSSNCLISLGWLASIAEDGSKINATLLLLLLKRWTGNTGSHFLVMPLFLL